MCIECRTAAKYHTENSLSVRESKWPGHHYKAFTNNKQTADAITRQDINCSIVETPTIFPEF